MFMDVVTDFGNKYTPSANERLDMWHWKGVRTGSVGQVDDQFVDNTKYDKEKAPEAGRKSDPNTGGAGTAAEWFNTAGFERTASKGPASSTGSPTRTA